MSGNIGNDLVNGNLGDDTVRGGQGDDIILGGVGNDMIYGDKGNDTLYGEAGNDMFVFAPESGSDIIKDFSSEDMVLIASSMASSALDALNQASFSQNGLVISFATGDSVTLSGINSLDVADILIY